MRFALYTKVKKQISKNCKSCNFWSKFISNLEAIKFQGFSLRK